MVTGQRRRSMYGKAKPRSRRPSTLQQARDDLQTKQYLGARGHAPAREVETLQLLVKSREATVAAATAARDVAQERVSTQLPADRVRAEVEQRAPGFIESYFTLFTAAREADDGVAGRYADYLAALFPDHGLDLVVAVGSPAMNFFRQHGRADTFPRPQCWRS